MILETSSKSIAIATILGTMNQNVKLGLRNGLNEDSIFRWRSVVIRLSDMVNGLYLMSRIIDFYISVCSK